MTKDPIMSLFSMRSSKRDCFSSTAGFSSNAGFPSAAAMLRISTGLSVLVGLGSLAACSAATPEPSAPATPPSARADVGDSAKHPVPEKAEPQAMTIENVDARGSFLAPLPLAVTSFGAATAGSAVYLLGGYSGTPHEYSKEGQSRDVLKLDLEEGSSWEKVGSLSRGLQGLAAVHYDGKVCHFGGNHASNEAGTEAQMTSVQTARCFDVATKSWTELPDLPEGRSSHAAAIIGGSVYVVGGWKLNGAASTGQFAENVLALDLTKSGANWEAIEAPFQRRALGVAAVSGKLVIVGGMDATGEVSKRVDIYDTTTKEWQLGPEHPGDAFGIAVTGHGPLAYASGREGIVRSFRPGETEWKTVRNLGFARFFHEMRVTQTDEGKEALVVFGGIGGMHTRGRTRIVEKLPLDGSLTYGQLSFETPAHAKNRYGLLLEGEQVYLFGGNLSVGQHDFERKHFSSEGWKLDLATLKFSEAANYPFERQSMQTIATASGGLSLGGFGHEPLETADSEAISQEHIFSYSWENDAWSSQGKMPRGRTQFGLVRGEGKLWIFGGLNYDPTRKDAFEHDQTIWVSDEKDVSFKTADVTLPGPRRAFAGAELDGKYYLIGGMKEGFQLVDDCLEFEFATKKFSTIPCPAPRLSGDLVAAGGKLYLLSGSVKTKDGIVESRAVDVFDPAKRTWTKLDFEIPVSTRHMRAVGFRSQILLLTSHFEDQKMTVGLLNP